PQQGRPALRRGLPPRPRRRPPPRGYLRLALRRRPGRGGRPRLGRGEAALLRRRAGPPPRRRHHTRGRRLSARPAAVRPARRRAGRPANDGAGASRHARSGLMDVSARLLDLPDLHPALLWDTLTAAAAAVLADLGRPPPYSCSFALLDVPGARDNNLRLSLSPD